MLPSCESVILIVPNGLGKTSMKLKKTCERSDLKKIGQYEFYYLMLKQKMLNVRIQTLYFFYLKRLPQT